MARIQRATDAAVYIQPAASLRNVEQGAVDLGFLVGDAPEARQLVGRIQQDVATIQQKLADVPPVPVFVDTGFFITVSDRSLLGDLVKRAKGTSVAGPSPGPGPVSARRPARREPAVLPRHVGQRHDARIARAPTRSPPTSPRCGRSGWSIVPADLVTRAGPRVAQGLEAIARALHPDAFQ